MLQSGERLESHILYKALKPLTELLLAKSHAVSRSRLSTWGMRTT